LQDGVHANKTGTAVTRTLLIARNLLPDEARGMEIKPPASRKSASGHYLEGGK